MSKMNDGSQEYRKDREVGLAAESKNAAEIKTIGEPRQASEIGTTERQSHKQNKPKSSILKALQTFVIGGIALAAIASSMIFPKDEPTANIGGITAFDTYAEYVVDVATTNDLELKLVIFNDYFNSEQMVLPGETIGIVEGLTPNKSYTIAVKGNFGLGDKTLSKKTFRTLLPGQVLRTRFNGIETACTCGVDGKFNFKLLYNDENNYWSNFSAVLETPNGNTQVAVCEFSQDTAKWQYFDVGGLAKGDYRLTVTVVSSDPKDRMAPVKTLYSGEIQI